LNGIFGNVDLLFHYLNHVEDILQQLQEKQNQNSVLSEDDNKQIEYLANQVFECSKSVLACAEHQKCMTDDVLQISRLQTHKISITNAYYSPNELLHTVANAFRAKAECKVSLSSC
jgi:hypothetical protein